jgi:hypothetical protein
MLGKSRHLAAVPLAALLVLAPAARAAAQTTDFARLSARLSEPGGYFDSDNLVSNETSYLHVLGDLRAARVRGGVYLGVGPEQSFSYIAEIRPELAILVDIRRDNLLLHLLLKAMFETARNRLEYLGLLYGRAVPRDAGRWADRDLADLLDAVDREPADSALHARQHAALLRRVDGYGFGLSDTDRATLRRFHDDFAVHGLALTFTSLGRPPRRMYPTARQLYLETDRDGQRGSYLASEERWQVVRDLQRRHRVVPAVGNLAGPTAMRAIAAYLRETRRTVSAFYLSNVEMYLFRDGSFGAFAANVRALPAADNARLIRSFFNRGWAHPDALPGHMSVQLAQPFARFLALADTASYWTIVTDAAGSPPPAPARP